MDIELLQLRAAVFRTIRDFFDQKAYLETDTPILAPDLIPESCLEVFETRLLPPGNSRQEAQPYWLIPSPEIWMKRLIARHCLSIYQICKCFRNGESCGRHHSPEFTMLEYYTLDAGYEDSLSLTEGLFRALLQLRPEAALPVPFQRITMDEAFSRWAGFSLYDAEDRLDLEAKRLGLDPLPGMGKAELYDLIFVHAVEPKLPRDGAVAIMDYPAFVPCLARKRPGGRSVERWELYVQGIELANCYSEETDPEEIRRYFEAEAAQKARNALVPHRIDRDYWKLGLPRCSGVALGLDRLLMVLSGFSTIDSVLPFTLS
jgi:lysyl-tRNA synthetase class 2